MTAIDRANDIIASAINKFDNFYEALWGKIDFTPEINIDDPNDYNCGAICNQIEYLCNWIERLTEKDIANMLDDHIDLISFFFALEVRLGSDESNESLLNRLYSFTSKKGQTPWATPWSIKKALSYYIPEENLFYVPNIVNTNLIVNGGFESTIGSEWVFNPSGDRSLGDPFTGDYKVDLTMSSLSQTISMTHGSYVYHLFAKGTPGDLFNVTFLRSSDGKYFNHTTLSWENSIQNNTFTSKEDIYQLCEFFLVVDGSYDVTIDIVRIKDCFIDRIELGLIEYPSFYFIYQNIGSGEGFASAWDGVSTNYPLASYTEQDFMFESGELSYTGTLIQSVIDKLRPAGVKGLLIAEVKAG